MAWLTSSMHVSFWSVMHCSTASLPHTITILVTLDSDFLVRVSLSASVVLGIAEGLGLCQVPNVQHSSSNVMHRCCPLQCLARLDCQDKLSCHSLLCSLSAAVGYICSTLLATDPPVGLGFSCFLLVTGIEQQLSNSRCLGRYPCFELSHLCHRS